MREDSVISITFGVMAITLLIIASIGGTTNQLLPIHRAWVNFWGASFWAISTITRYKDDSLASKLDGFISWSIFSCFIMSVIFNVYLQFFVK